MDNLDGLSKPAAFMCDADDGREYNGHNEFSFSGKGAPLYSQEYVDSLLAKLEAAEKEISDWRSIAGAAAQDDADWHKLVNSKNEVIVQLAQGIIKSKDRAEAAEARRLVPVKLPTDEIGEAASFVSDAEVIPVSIVIGLIKAAGYPVEGGE